MYRYIIKGVFCLGLVFVMLPEEEVTRLKEDVAQAVAQDRIVKATVKRTHLAARTVKDDAHTFCLQKPDECVEAARQITQRAAGRQ